MCRDVIGESLWHSARRCSHVGCESCPGSGPLKGEGLAGGGGGVVEDGVGGGGG